MENAVVDTLRAAAEAVARAEAEGATMAAAAAARAERASLAAAEQPGGKSVRSLDVRPGSVFTVAGLSKAELQLVATAEESAAKLPPSLAAYGDELWSFPNTEGGGSAHASVEVADIVASITPPPDVHIDAAVTVDAAATTSYGCNILRNLLRVDALLPRPLVAELHTLYLSCLPDPTFKRAFSDAFADLYVSLAVQYAGGVGTRDGSIFGFSVQLFTTPSIVHMLLKRHILTRVLLALDYTLHAASVREPLPPSAQHGPRAEQDALASSWRPSPYGQVPRLDCDAPVLTHRRHDYVVRDLEYILTIDGVARQFALMPALYRHWLRTLSRLQHADLQLRFVTAHIEHDSRSWITAFNLHLSLSSAFPVLLKPLSDLAAPPGRSFHAAPAGAIGLDDEAVLSTRITGSLRAWDPPQHALLPHG